MSKILISSVETYRFDSEEEVVSFLESVKDNNKYTLLSYSSRVKNLKSKGEIVDSWFQVQVKKVFNDEKEPSLEGNYFSTGLGDN